MIPYARLSPGPGFAPGRAALYYAQRAVTLPPARRAISSAIAATIRRRQGGSAGALAADCAGALAALRRDGFARIAPIASDAALGEMVDYFLRQPVAAPGGELVPVDRLPADTAVAPYPLTTVLRCPGLTDLLSRPFVLGVAAEYLGCKPTLSSVGVRWSFPTAGAGVRTQDFHRDVDDWRFLKLFVYLTDVDKEAGPHCYVRGSHRTGFGLKAKAYERAQLERRYGADALVTITGARGAAFIADTLGIHRGDPPRRRPRLILQVQYSLLPVFAFDYPPAQPAAPDMDAYCNRLFFRPPPSQAAAQGRSR